MPAASFGLAPSASRPAFDQRRRSERRACHDRILLRGHGGELSATLTDLSAGGFGFLTGALTVLKPGESLLLLHPQLGEVACVLRWAAHPRYGAEFQAGSRALRRILAFHDSLPRSPGDLL